MKLISWNVNGLRACLTHDFAASFAALDADVFSVQETISASLPKLTM